MMMINNFICFWYCNTVIIHDDDDDDDDNDDDDDELYLKVFTHEEFCSWSMLKGHFARVSTHEGPFVSLDKLTRDLAPKIIFNWFNIMEHFVGWKCCFRG